MAEKMKNDIRLSKFLSLILRHKPEVAGIALDESGWANVRELIDGVCKSGRHIDIKILECIVSENDKQRFSFNEDKTKIRANQGHGIAVELELDEVEPPDILYHGTATRFLESIREKGILKQSRQHIHLSSDIKTAIAVGKRHGVAVVLPIDVQRMQKEGHIFYLSVNKVWLCDNISSKYIKWEEIIYN